MATNPPQGSGSGMSRTYAGQGYDVTYFARKHGLSRQQARELIRQVGHDRKKLNEAAFKLKA